ncbi:hypothetical protein PR202_ga15813 [Eleusine coracana subsp. coracana]|uniref:Ionotropic glutamate receptor C-terminal domain-containing protein n=1 Tax=Eleusine coracana subsp. coracana TaxID=191504 RepID=A0AAV5CL95_ELECO|nr:hypothetical protein PR202_ga15813 [Eleusine coracana subsp. coracana]
MFVLCVSQCVRRGGGWTSPSRRTGRSGWTSLCLTCRRASPWWCRSQRSKRAWVFVKPLRYDLWLVSFAFLVFTGFAVWAWKHRINEEFRGPPSYQIGTLLYFGFSTLVFSHRESLKSNLSRFAVVVWVFVVLILQSSYTASLTSMLTVPQLGPTIGDYGELWRARRRWAS